MKGGIAMLERIASFIVDKRLYILIAMGVLAVISALLIPRVEINYDMADYLPDDSETTIGLERMEDEFGRTGTAQVMLLGVDASTASEVASDIDDFADVQFVTFDEHSEEHYLPDEQDGAALLQVTIDGDDFSQVAEEVVVDIDEYLDFHGHDYHLGGPAVSNYELQEAVLSELPLIMIMAITIVLAILWLNARSWLEPVAFIVVVIIAILINMGTNFLYGEISYITQSVAAVLQLGLSMNYSIMLLNRFHQEREEMSDEKPAMQRALARSIAPISSSSLTTVAGMVALTFMTFEIGMDLGLVLAKGILSSLITVFLVLPGLLVIFAKWFERTRKKPINLKGEPFAKLSIQGSRVLPALTLVLFFLAFAVQSTNDYFFADDPDLEGAERIEEVFGKSVPLTAITEATDDVFDEQEALLDSLEDYEIDGEPVLLSDTGYVSTALAPLDPEDVALLTALDEESAGVLFSLYHLENSNMDSDTIVGEDLLSALYEATDEDQIAEVLGEEVIEEIEVYHEFMESLDEEMTFDEAAAAMDSSEFEMLFIYFAYHSEDYDPEEPLLQQALALATAIITGEFDGSETIPLGELILFIDELEREGAITLSEEEREELDEQVAFVENIEEEMSYEDLAERFDVLPADATRLIYAFYFQYTDETPDLPIRARDLIEFIEIEIEENELLAEEIGEEEQEMIDYAIGELEFADEMFNGEEYSRMILTLDIPKEGSDTFDFVDFLRDEADETFTGEAFFAGEIISNYDMADAFDEDLLRISLITVGAIILLVTLAFRAYLLPFVLVMVIQGAIWMSMSVSAVLDQPIFFMTYIVVTAIQMGATVDYGILISSNYLEQRHYHSKREALRKAVNNSLPTVFTSGLILITAGLAVGIVSSQMAIYSVGYLLARGASVSVLFVLLLLPSILYTLDRLLEKTTIGASFKD